MDKPLAIPGNDRLARLGPWTLLLLVLVAVVVFSGCSRFRCGPAIVNWDSGSEHVHDEIPIEEVAMEQPEERPVSRFHPVPAWDVFHPPVDLSYDDPVASDRCIQPFYLPAPRNEQ